MKIDVAVDELKRRINVIPLVKREEVEETKQLLQSGKYRINTTAVARSLLREQVLNEMLLSA